MTEILDYTSTTIESVGINPELISHNQESAARKKGEIALNQTIFNLDYYIENPEAELPQTD